MAMVDALFLQSADPERYGPLLELTSRTVKEYCRRHGYGYQCFVGIIRGQHAWHAALNRIPILRWIAASGYRGWVVYVDADAYIFDLSFDLAGFLAKHGDRALVAAASGVLPARWWDLNTGVFAFNLTHPGAHRIIEAWNERLDRIAEEDLRGEVTWGQVADDQDMLHRVLQEEPEAQAWVALDQENTVNYTARFIRQVLRADYSDFSARVDKLRYAVGEVMARGGEGVADAPDHRFLFDELVRALYRTLLGREPDPGGFAAAVGALRDGRQTVEGQIKMTLTCAEFLEKLPEFAAAYGKRFEPAGGEVRAGRGYLDKADHDCVEGWAEGLDGPAVVSIHLNGARVATVVANRYRPDVAQAGIGDGALGFFHRFSPMLDPAQRHEVRARNETTGAELKGSPIRLAAAKRT